MSIDGFPTDGTPLSDRAWRRNHAARSAEDLSRDIGYMQVELRATFGDRDAGDPATPCEQQATAYLGRLVTRREAMTPHPHRGNCTVARCDETHEIPRPTDGRAATLVRALHHRLRDGDLEDEPIGECFNDADFGGVMLGVLVCTNKRGAEVILRAYSGVQDYDGRDDLEGDGNQFCGPITARRQRDRRLCNFSGVHKLFSAFPRGEDDPPVGICACPKLLQAAVRLDLIPVEMAEIWYDKHNATLSRGDRVLYESCPTCEANIGFQLHGIEVRRERWREEAEQAQAISEWQQRLADVKAAHAAEKKAKREEGLRQQELARQRKQERQERHNQRQREASAKIRERRQKSKAKKNKQSKSKNSRSTAIRWQPAPSNIVPIALVVIAVVIVIFFIWFFRR